jgi:hypothetical protein
LQACLNKAPEKEVHRLAEQAENELLSEPDPEDKYSQGAILAACGEKQIAFAFLRKAVAENYCAHQALQSDRCLEIFEELLSSANCCPPPKHARIGFWRSETRVRIRKRRTPTSPSPKEAKTGYGKLQ